MYRCVFADYVSDVGQNSETSGEMKLSEYKIV